ncbi:hypothetical protein HY629_02725 [Candidatus Uhrbacteria bacterium]|nr:hypothetical protein [Candidatus Uhrbacteria bacterium]
MRSSRGCAVAIAPRRTSLQQDIALKGDGEQQRRMRRWATIEIVCKGTTPLLMNAFHTEDYVRRRAPSIIRCPVPETKTLEEMARRRLFTDERGRIGIPAVNLFAALRHAGREVKFFGRRMVSTQSRSMLSSFLAIEEEFLVFTSPRKWVADVRKGAMLKDCSKIIGIVRPRFDKWGFRATLRVDLNQVSVELVRELLVKAGIRAGFCSFRPACNGVFGQFKVTVFRMK